MIETFCKAIQSYEGWEAGSRSYRNNNPGNLRYTSYSAGLGAASADKDGFCVFPDYQTGFNALQQLVKDAANGLLKAYHAPVTILSFFQTFAPSSDGNNPRKYAEFVAQQCGAKVGSVLAKIL